MFKRFTKNDFIYFSGGKALAREGSGGRSSIGGDMGGGKIKYLG